MAECIWKGTWQELCCTAPACPVHGKGRCVICGEWISGEAAEMYDPLIDSLGITDDERATAEGLAGLVHAECGIAKGWEVA